MPPPRPRTPRLSNTSNVPLYGRFDTAPGHNTNVVPNTITDATAYSHTVPLTAEKCAHDPCSGAVQEDKNKAGQQQHTTAVVSHTVWGRAHTRTHRNTGTGPAQDSHMHHAAATMRHVPPASPCSTSGIRGAQTLRPDEWDRAERGALLTALSRKYSV